MQYSLLAMLAITLVATFGFALFFNVNKRHVVPAVVGGVLTWTLDYALMQMVDGVFIPCMVASIFAAVYAEVLARVTRTPVVVFFIVSVIPLIPGRALYYTMYNAVSGNFSHCADYGMTTLLYVAGIAVGICIVTAVVQTWNHWAADKASRFAKMLKKQARKAAKRSTDAS